MVITYHGLQFFKVQFGDTVVAFDPPSESSEYKSARFGADVALSSLRHDDFDGVDLLTAGDREPFPIHGPGEYEVNEVFIKGLPSTSHYQDKKRINTIYLVTLEGMNICFLGALGSIDDLTPEVLEELDEIDILFIPIGGGGVLTPAEAYKFAVKLEASVIIPMHFTDLKDEALSTFLEEEGSDDAVKPADKLTLKPKDVSGEEGAIHVLEPFT